MPWRGAGATAAERGRREEALRAALKACVFMASEGGEERGGEGRRGWKEENGKEKEAEEITNRDDRIESQAGRGSEIRSRDQGEKGSGWRRGACD